MKIKVLLIFLSVVVLTVHSQSTKIDSLTKLWKKTSLPDSSRAIALKYLTWNYIFVNPDSALKLNNEEIKLAKKINNDLTFGNVYLNRAFVFNQLTQYDSSIFYLNKARERYKICKYENGIGRTYATEGGIYIYMGNYPKAQDSYQTAKKFYEKTHDTIEIAAVNSNLGLVFYSYKNYNKAIEFQRKAMDVYLKRKDDFRLGFVFKSLADLFDMKANYDSASFYYEKALECHKKTGSVSSYGDLYCSIGIMKGAQGKHKEALEYYNKALAYDVALKNDYMISVIYSNMGQAYLDLKDYKNAERATQEGIKHATIVDSKNDIMVNTSILALAYEGLGEKGKALSAYKLYMNLKDSLFNEEKVSEAAEKEMTFEFTKERLRDSIKNLDEQNLIKEKVKVKEAEIKQGKTIRFTLIGGLIMVVVFAFFFYNRFRVTQKQKKIIEKQKEEVHRQKEIIEEHQKETIDSINYAKRIQYALLAQDDLLSQYIPNHFVLFNPKDIVSGDFYWAAEHNQKFYLAVCDSTGHGVPGAFMSLLNMGFLSEAIKEKSIEEPHEVLNYVRRRLIDSIGNDGQKDGMDAILICVDRNSEIITYAAANNEPILIRENEVIALPKDRMPVGKGEKDNSFTLHTISAKSGDVLYLYTDGYADQFGGPKGKKYKYKQLNELLLSMNGDSLINQKSQLESNFINWKGSLEQVDDVLIVGIKI